MVLKERSIMVISNNDFIRITYVGKVKESGEVFDTTEKDVAKQQGIYDKKIQFKPSPIVVGAKHVITGLDEKLVGMEVGETKIVIIPFEKGYGKRDPKLVQVVPMKTFKQQGMKPFPGMQIEGDGRVGRVQSVSGGRVRVDFNYKLAGKVLEYNVSIKEKVNKLEERIRLLLELHLPFANPNDHGVKIKNKNLVIRLSDEAKLKKEVTLSKQYLSRDVFNFINLNTLTFEEVFKNPEVNKNKVDKKKNKAT
jgi:FKBP-type peptidyl-prolyl cis-trans isomerase 2